MAVSGIGRMTARAAGSAAGVLGELIGSGAYPETEYALAAYLFERIVQAEKDKEAKGPGLLPRPHGRMPGDGAGAAVDPRQPHFACGRGKRSLD